MSEVTEQMKKEGYLNMETLHLLKDNTYCECHKGKLLDNGWREKCILGNPEMYEHDGGEWVEGQSTKQWIYFTCSRCGYQWSLKKLLNRYGKMTLAEMKALRKSQEVTQ